MKLRHVLIAFLLLAPLASAHAQDSDSLTWARANTCDSIRAYIARFPNGRYVAEARNQLSVRNCADPARPAANPCQTAETRWTGGLRTSTDRAALRRFIDETDARCAIVRDAAQARLAGLDQSAAAERERQAAAERQRQAEAARQRQAQAPAQQTRTAGQRFRDCEFCPEMVVIPAGSFVMGSPASEPNRQTDEGPQRTVSVRAFAAGRFEVTFDDWAACVNRGGCTGNANPADQGWGRGNRPVINVSWEDARQYVQWLSRETGRSYRLLTEAEWEYAARAGTTTAYHTGASIGTNHANFNQALGRTQTVGAYPANAFGLHDMHGNVWEWVQDCYASSYSGLPTDGSANETSCSNRVYRGGSWLYSAQDLRSANRSGSAPTDRYVDFGFRVARTL